MLEVVCSGSPDQIGRVHGEQAASQVRGSIAFYKAYFQETVQLDWPSACTHAERFLPFLSQHVPQLLEEIRGLASGANVPVASILALNVRTEIVYGLSKDDGCTALSWHNSTSGKMLLAQNWDWRPTQTANLINLTIVKPSGHRIMMVTEAGIIGKIGFNSAGIGVCLNAIRVPGVDYGRLPVHLTLRKILDLEEGNIDEVLAKIQYTGVASSAHVLVVSATGQAFGIETTYKTVVLIRPQQSGRGEILLHTNHLIGEHEGIKENIELPDTVTRLARIEALVKDQIGGLSVQAVQGMLKDEDGYPVSICRAGGKDGRISTVFSIVMDLNAKEGFVKVGRPTEDGQEIVLRC